MRNNVQYYFPALTKEDAVLKLEDAIASSIETALSKVTSKNKIYALTVKILGIVSPVDDILEEVVKIALNPKQYGYGELTTVAIKLAAKALAPKFVEKIIAKVDAKYIVKAALEVIGVGSSVLLIDNINLNTVVDLVLGTLDAELRVIDQNQNILGGGVYINGLGDEREDILRAIGGLLRYADNRQDIPRIKEGTQIAFLRPQVESNALLVFTLYDGKFISQLAETTGKSIEGILSIDNVSNINREYYRSYGDKKFLVMGDTDELDVEILSTGKVASFTPKQIFYTNENGVLTGLDKKEISSAYTNNSANNLFVGNTGNDTISAFLGDDILLGGKGNDTLNGGNGIDILIGGSGNDSYYAGLYDIIIDDSSSNNQAFQSSSDGSSRNISGNYSNVKKYRVEDPYLLQGTSLIDNWGNIDSQDKIPEDYAIPFYHDTYNNTFDNIIRFPEGLVISNYNEKNDQFEGQFIIRHEDSSPVNNGEFGIYFGAGVASHVNQYAHGGINGSDQWQKDIIAQLKQELPLVTPADKATIWSNLLDYLKNIYYPESNFIRQLLTIGTPKQGQPIEYVLENYNGGTPQIMTLPGASTTISITNLGDLLTPNNNRSVLSIDTNSLL